MDDSQLLVIGSMEFYMQCIFSFDSILHFFVEHHSSTQLEPERDLWKLFIINIKSRFIFDALTIIPFFELFEGLMELKYRKLLYLIRLLRLYRGF